MDRRHWLAWALAGGLGQARAAPPDLPGVIAEAAAAAPLTHAVAVEQHGRLLAEAYFSAADKPSGAWLARTVAFDAATLHDMRSVSKSVVALLAGIAQGRGQLDPDRPVMDWFPELAELATPQRRAIRLEHLLTMTAGLDWDETTVSYANPTNSETRMNLAYDPVKHVLAREMVAEPGSRFAYSGGNTMVLAEIVARASGRAIDDLAGEALLAPLGIEAFEWRRHPVWRKPLAFSGLRLAPHSMIRLGRLMLDGGRAGGREIVPAAWVADLQRPHVTSTGQGLAYGWHWWLGRVPDGPAHGTGWCAGLGNGGQVLMVVPALDATVAVTAGRYNVPASGRPSLAICRRVIEALTGGS